MMSLFTCVQNQLPESDGNGETNPLDVPLDEIAEDLLAFLNEVKRLRDAKKEIERKYDIKKEQGDCWPADDIKRAWGQTQRMDEKSRRYWAHVIIFQILKRFMVHDGCKPNDNTTNETMQSCETRPGMKENSEDASSRSKAELETVGAAGGDEQMFGELIPSEISKLSEDSGVVSGSQLSASSTDEAPSPAEVNPTVNSSNSETKNAALNEDEDDSYDQQEDVDDYELFLKDIHDLENETWEDDLWSAADINQACGKAESMKGNSGDRSSQSSAELETVEAAGEARQSSGANQKSSKSGLNQTGRASQGRSGARFPAGSQAKNDPGARSEQSKANVSAASEAETIYIRIPFSAMFSSRSPVSQRVAHNPSHYKLINGFPSDTGLRIRKSYAMSFDTETMNAELVYEILNRQTLENNCERPEDFGQGYVKGHLAAAANHKWCREANNDANLFSNMVPQNSALNNGKWKALEIKCRSVARRDRIRNVHVYSGPLYLRSMNPLVLGVKKVPSHLFKVIIIETENGTIMEPVCYLMPNEAPPANVRRVNIENIQTVSGLTFIERRPNVNMRNYTKSVILQGEGGHGQPHEVNISVIMSS